MILTHLASFFLEGAGLVEAAAVHDHLCYRVRVRPTLDGTVSVQAAMDYRAIVKPTLSGTVEINPC